MMKMNVIVLLLALAGCFASCQQAPSADGPVVKKGMIKVTIFYPNGEGKTFDMDYYSQKHMPMVASLLKPMKFFKIDKGVAAGRPGESLPYLAIGYLFFDQLSDYESSFGPNAEQILNDIPNYTNAQPIVQVSEVVE